MAKRYDQQVEVDLDGGLPSAFSWNGRSYHVVDVIGRWRIEGRWWEDGRDREYWRVEVRARGVRGGSSSKIANAEGRTASGPPSQTVVCDLYRDRSAGRWHLERLWD
ncbi:MAG: DUF6504 family protein [Actinomycetota bacterium]